MCSTRDFLKIKNFKIKAKNIKFESVQHMTDLEKSKIYVAFVKLLNNHFKFTLFKKNLYQHFTNHCGFIAHYNLNGFYGEYFATAAKYHCNINGYKTPAHECGGNLNESSDDSNGEMFYAIYEELNGSRVGLGEFYDGIMSNQNWGGYSDYVDLDDALKEAFNEYLEIWREEIKKAIKAKDKFLKIEKVQELKVKENNIKQKQNLLNESMSEIQQELNDELTTQLQKVSTVEPGMQLSLFDLLEVA